MIVVDASALVAILVRDETAAPIAAYLTGKRLYAPAHVDVEVAHAIRALLLRGAIDETRASLAISILPSFPAQRVLVARLLPRIWALRATNLTADDAAYIVLAELTKGALVTRDARLARAGGHTAKVKVFQ